MHTGALNPGNWTGRAVNRYWHATEVHAGPLGVNGIWAPDNFFLGPNVINYRGIPADVRSRGLNTPANPFTNYPLTQG